MFKRFISYYRPHLGLFIFDMCAAVIVAVCNLFYPTIAKNIINEYVYDDTPKRIIFWAAVLLLIYILKAVCNYIIGYYGHVVGVRMQRDMRRDLFCKYQRLPFSYFDGHKTGDLISRLVNDLFDVSELAHHGPENLFLAVLMIIGAMIMLVNINVTLTLIMLCILPLIILCTVLSRKNMMGAMRRSRKEMSAINSTIENSLGGIRETKAYVAEHAEICKFNTSNHRFAKERQCAMRSLGSFDSIMQLLQDVLYLAIIFAGGLFLYYGKIDGGQFAAFILYIGMFLNPIQRFVALFQQLQEGSSGFRRFHEIMNEPDEEDGGTLELENISGSVSFRNVTFGYEGGGACDVISNFSLDIKAGETVALVGPSGGGKTTICNLIPRFYNVREGSITIDGVDVRELKLRNLRSHIGTVSQSIFLFDGTVRENIAYGSDNATEEDIILAAKRANIHEYVSGLPDGYDTEVGERGVKLSGGQRQRIAIARVFLKNPSLLILDEATSALDNATEMLVQESLSKLSVGRTVLVVAHRLSTVKNADKIVVVGESGIIEMGTHEELIAKGGEYHKLYNYQFKEQSV